MFPRKFPWATKTLLGEGFGCFTDDMRVECIEFFEPEIKTNAISRVPPALTGPFEIKPGYNHVCAREIANGRLRCWGDDYSGETQVPWELDPVRDFSTSGRGTCALTDTEIRCWGIFKFRQSTSYDYQKIAMMREGVCAMASDRVDCWQQQMVEAPEQKAQTTTAGVQYASELEPKQVQPSKKVQKLVAFTPAMGLRNATQLAAGWEHGCVLSDNGVQCWGNFDMGEKISGPMKVAHPQKIFAAFNSTCVIDQDQNPFCFGYDSVEGLKPVPTPSPMGDR